MKGTPRFVSGGGENAYRENFSSIYTIATAMPFYDASLAKPFAAILRLDGAAPPNCQLYCSVFITRARCTRVYETWERMFKGQS